MTDQLPNIHIGTCGLCQGNVTRIGDALPRCEQCGSEPVIGPVLPMKAAPDNVYDPPPLVRDSKGRFRRPGEA